MYNILYAVGVAVTLIIDALEDMQSLIIPRDSAIPSDVLSDSKLSKILRIFDLISTANLSCGKIPQPESIDICRDVMDIVLDALESRDTSDSVLTHLEQLRFVLSQPFFQVWTHLRFDCFLSSVFLSLTCLFCMDAPYKQHNSDYLIHKKTAIVHKKILHVCILFSQVSFCFGGGK